MTVVVITTAVLVMSGIAAFQSKLGVDRGDAGAPVMDFVRGARSQGQIYLVPQGFERFRLYTGVPIYVDKKSHPYKDTEVLEWYHRIGLARRFYDDGDCSVLASLHTDAGVTHVVLGTSHACAGSTALAETYRDEVYSVYRITLETNRDANCLECSH
jgi:hypothetical protein